MSGNHKSPSDLRRSANRPAKNGGQRLPYITKVEPNSRYDIWCAFCEYHLDDSMNMRKRMGQHMVDNHPEEMRFLKGVEPNDLEDERVSQNG